jgi:glutamate decarboxylase
MIKDGAKPGYSLFELSDRLRVRGWQVAAYSMLPNITDVVVMRVLIRHGFTRDMADMLLQDIERSIDYLKKHPPGTPQVASEGTTFTHHGSPKVPAHVIAKDDRRTVAAPALAPSAPLEKVR